MEEDTSAELIALCEEILDDAEVTIEEVRRLGDWLAIHEAARHAWPGKELAAPVQEALLDGKITQTELRRIAALLRRVEKQWVKQRQEAVQQAALERAMAAAQGMDLSCALLPMIPVTLPIRSHSDKAVIYDVDLSGPSCACPDWRGGRNQLPRGSLSRCCKHILDAFGQLRPAHGWPGWLGAFLEYGWKPHPTKRWFVVRDGSHFVLASVGGNEWSDVFAIDGEEYQRFGFNVVEQRWSYGRFPSTAAIIERAILNDGGANATAEPGRPSLLGRLFGRS
jgi:hypothetical protein